MLNEYLRKDESHAVDIMDCNVQIGDTGIAPVDSVNLGPKRLAKQRFQRMRRRQDRALFSGNGRLGWATRMM